MAPTLGVDTSVKVKPTAHLLIGELAQEAGVSTRMVRYYEQQGLLEASRSSAGYRVFSPDSVRTVRQITTLIGAGFGTESLRVLLPCVVGEEPTVLTCPAVQAELRRVLDRLEREATAAHQRYVAATSLLARGRAEDDAHAAV